MDDLQDEVHALGTEDVADKGEGVADHKDGHPGQEAAHVVACAYPLVAEKEDEHRFGKEEDEWSDQEDAASKQKNETPNVASQGQMALRLGGDVLVEDLLECVGQHASWSLGEGEGQRKKPQEGFVKMDAQPHQWKVGGETADQLARHDVARKVDVFVCKGTQWGRGGLVIAMLAAGDMAEVEVSAHFAQHGAQGEANGVEEVHNGSKEAEEEARGSGRTDGDHFAYGQSIVFPVTVAEEYVDAVGARKVDKQGEENQQQGREFGWADAKEGHEDRDSEQEEGDQGVEPERETGKVGGFTVALGYDDGHLEFAGGEDDEDFCVAEKDIAQAEVVGGEQAQQQRVGHKGKPLGNDVAGEQGAGVFYESGGHGRVGLDGLLIS